MEDQAIVQLYFDRDERAISQTQTKYSSYLFCIANNVLNNFCDAEEVVNDCYLSLWNCIPPTRPKSLKYFAGAITRNLSLNRYDYNTAKKRDCAFVDIDSEFNACFSNDDKFDDEIAFSDLINKFLSKLNKKSLIIFLRRYWYFDSVSEISSKLNVSESNVKVILFRVREKLKKYLVKEGIKLWKKTDCNY